MNKLLVLSFLLLLLSGCHRKQKNVTVSGTVFDAYTGNPMPGVRVQLRSQSSGGHYPGYKSYYTSTDREGKYYFRSLKLVYPYFRGDITVNDPDTNYVSYSGAEIDNSETKFLGKAHVTKNIKGYYTSKLNIHAPAGNYALILINSAYMPPGSAGVAVSGDNYYTNQVRPSMVYNDYNIKGYPDGKTVLRFDVIPVSSNTMKKIIYDTIVSAGVNTVQDYYIKLN